MKLPLSRFVLLFILGAGVAPFGDHGHVVSGTTYYLSRAVPFVWDSPLWFPVLVGMATAATAELRLWLGPARPGRALPDGLAGIAAVMGLYALTALLFAQPLVPATLLITALAILVWRVLGDGPALVCGLLLAVTGSGVEMLLAAAGVFGYADSINRLFGVAPWLPALYFAFGVVAARLGELAAPAAQADAA